MNAQKWTAGGSEKTTAVWVKDENGKTVCSVASCADDWDRARLIASAPDLLQALQRLADVAHRPTGWSEEEHATTLVHALLQANEAIAKARGE